MIALTRAVIRQFRNVVRRIIPNSRLSLPTVVLQGGPNGTKLQCFGNQIAVQLEHRGTQPLESVNLPLAALTDCEGKGDDGVSFQKLSDDRGQMTWSERGIPKSQEFTINGGEFKFLALPKMYSDNELEILDAFNKATQCSAKQATKYAVDCLQLRGEDGEIIGGDTYQLLIQAGSRFPWKERVIVPRFPIVRRELGTNRSVDVGRNDKHVVLLIGDWTFCLLIDQTSRYPDCDVVVPKKDPATRLWIDKNDAIALVRSLPDLPGFKDAIRR